jgi:hypothetical protein
MKSKSEAANIFEYGRRQPASNPAPIGGNTACEQGNRLLPWPLILTSEIIKLL